MLDDSTRTIIRELEINEKRARDDELYISSAYYKVRIEFLRESIKYDKDLDAIRKLFETAFPCKSKHKTSMLWNMLETYCKTFDKYKMLEFYSNMMILML